MHPNAHVFDFWAENTIGMIASSTIGAVIASRRPEHPMGWLFCTFGLVGGVNHLSTEYAIYALLAVSGSLPGGEVTASIVYLISIPYLGLFVLFAPAKLGWGRIISRSFSRDLTA